MLHRSVENVFLDLLEENGFPRSEWKVHHESRIECRRDTTFSIDIIFEHKSGFKIYFLVKSIEKSYNKNRQNYANGLAGEVLRIFGESEKVSQPDRREDMVVTFTMLPDVVPVGNKFENVKYAKDSVHTLRRMHPSMSTGVHTMRVIPEQSNHNSSSYLDSFTGDVEERNKEELNEQLKEFLENVKSSVQLRENSKEG